MGIGTLKKFDPSAHELLTESVDEKRWWETIKIVVDFMMAKFMSWVCCLIIMVKKLGVS